MVCSVNEAASSGAMTLVGAPTSCSQFGRAGSRFQAAASWSRYSPCRTDPGPSAPCSAAEPLNTHECVTVASPWSAACSGPKGWASSYQAASYCATVTSGRGRDPAPDGADVAGSSRASRPDPPDEPAESADSPSRAAATIAAAHAWPCSAVMSCGAGCGACANWFTSLPMVMPSRFGLSATARASARTYAAVDATTSGSVNMFRRCQLSSHAGTKSKLDRCPCRASTLTSSPNEPAMSTTVATSCSAEARMSVRFGCTTGQSGKIRTWSAPSEAIASRSLAVSDGEKSSHEWNQPTEGV